MNLSVKVMVLMKKLTVHFKMVSKTLNELVAENTHTGSHTNHCPEREDAVEVKLLIPLYKSAALIMFQGSVVKKIQ